MSNVENPGVSAINVFSSILYNLVEVVVFFPLLLRLLISPSCVNKLLNNAFINVDFPTPEFPENAFILPFNAFFNSSIPIFSFATVFITLYPIFLYVFSIFKKSSFLSKSILFKTIIGLIFKNSENASCLSSSNKSGFGFFH